MSAADIVPPPPVRFLYIEAAVKNFLYAVTIHNPNFSIAANARALRRIGSVGSGFCFNGRIVFLLATLESSEAVTGFFASEFGEVPTVQMIEADGGRPRGE
jgi:hypothetical protein